MILKNPTSKDCTIDFRNDDNSMVQYVVKAHETIELEGFVADRVKRHLINHCVWHMSAAKNEEAFKKWEQKVVV